MNAENLLIETKLLLEQTTKRKKYNTYRPVKPEQREQLFQLLKQCLNFFNRREITFFFKKFPTHIFSIHISTYVEMIAHCKQTVKRNDIKRYLIIRKNGIFFTDNCKQHTGKRLFYSEESLKVFLTARKYDTLVAELATNLLEYNTEHLEQLFAESIIDKLESIGLSVQSKT